MLKIVAEKSYLQLFSEYIRKPITNQSQTMKNLAIKDSEEITEVIFYYEEEYQTVIAYFPVSVSEQNKVYSCYTTDDGFSNCNSFYVRNLRLAMPDEYRQTMTDLMSIYGYNLRITN